MKKLVHNVETGDVKEVEMTKAEIAQIEKDNVTMLAELQAEKESADAKESAIAKLVALGLTREEALAIKS